MFAFAEVLLNVLFASIFVGTLYLTPAHIRRFSHNNPVQINNEQHPDGLLCDNQQHEKCLQSETLGPFPERFYFISVNGRPVRTESPQTTFHEVANPQQATSVAHRIVPTPVPTPSVAKKSEFFHGSGITFFSTESIF